jgi:non-specific protein-tyrosine kinase
MPSMRKLVAAAGVILGGGLGLFVALLLEFLDPFVRTARDAQGITGCDLALEFQLAPYEDDALIDHVVPTAPVSVLFRRIINDLNTALEPRQWRSLAITSAEAGSGRSLVAINLASALGLKDEVTLVVDADVRADAGTRPSSILGIEALHPAQTITEVLSGAARPEDAFEPTVNPFVRLLTAGDYHNDNGLLLLGSRGFKDLAQHFDRERMHVLYDLPPLQAMESVGEAAAAVGNVMLVARSGHTRRSDLKQVTATLKAREIEIRAVVVTAIPQDLLSNKPAFASAPQPNPLFFRKHQAKDTEIKDTGPLIGDDVMIN